jgi:hypothetical protein
MNLRYDTVLENYLRPRHSKTSRHFVSNSDFINIQLPCTSHFQTFNTWICWYWHCDFMQVAVLNWLMWVEFQMQIQMHVSATSTLLRLHVMVSGYQSYYTGCPASHYSNEYRDKSGRNLNPTTHIRLMRSLECMELSFHAPDAITHRNWSIRYYSVLELRLFSTHERIFY